MILYLFEPKFKAFPLVNKKDQIIDLEDFSTYLKFLRKNALILLVFGGLGLIIALFYVHRVPEIYASKAQILLNSGDVYDYQKGLLKGLGVDNSYQSYNKTESQKRVLQSSSLINSTLDRLGFDVSYFIVGRIRTTEVFENTPFRVESDHFGGGAYGRLFGLRILDSNSYSLTFNLGEEQVVREYKFGDRILDHGFNFTVNLVTIKSPKIIEEIKKTSYEFQVNPRGALLQRFQGSLSIQSLEWTSILELTLSDRIPERASMFLDTLSATYIDYTVENKRAVNENTQAFIEKQIGEVVSLLDEIERELESYRETRAILDLSKEESEYFEKLVEYESQLNEVNLRLSSIKSLEDYMVNTSDKMMLPPSLYILEGDLYLKESINEFYSLQIERNNRLFNSTENNPYIIEIDAKIDRQRKNVLTYLENSTRAFEEQKRAVEVAVNKYTEKVKSIPKSQREILNIRRKLQIHENLYTFLLERKAETVIAEASIIPETKVIESARTIGLIAPNKNRIYGTFVLVGLLIGISLSVIRWFLIDRVESVKELMGLTPISVIGGVVQYLEKKDDGEYLISVNQPKSALAESYRAIRVNLEFTLGEMEKKPGIANKILVTSILPGEGKTFTSSNIGAILSIAHKRTVILDFDLHKPKIHRALQLDNKVGITNFLIGTEPVENIVKGTQLPNLDVISAGPIPPNGSELVMSKRVADLIRFCEENYDYVILDTPPIGPISDALVLSSYADASLFVINVNNATRRNIRSINEFWENKSIGKVALILNGIRKKRMLYSYTGYGYGYGYGLGYGYGYGYGQEYKDEES
ncbi:polysaccharide biosynthesis tyrosine autokinase [bacterium SCSIO 12741]|nr:polysaccharide biosynthesis tyrosine autokinase [bacterium SCSIO 12741]